MRLESSAPPTPLQSIENNEPKKVVRVFLLQAIDPRTVTCNEDLENISLVQVILTKKNEYAKNPGQIMPLGGNVNVDKTGKEESLASAAAREGLEETHILFSDLKQLKSTQTYSFKNIDGVKHRHITFFVGTLFSPKFDQPYPLDNNEDKIDSFPKIPTNRLERSFEEGSFGGDELVDSLDPNSYKRAILNTDTDQQEVEAIHQEVVREAQIAETKQKIKVLTSFKYNVKTSSGIKNDITVFEEKIKNLHSDLSDEAIRALYRTVEHFWNQNIESISGGYENVKASMRFLEAEHVIDDLLSNAESEKPFKGMPTIQIMFSILFGFEFDPKIITLIEKNPQLSKLYAMSQVIYLYNEMQKVRKNVEEENLNKEQAINRLLRKFMKIEKTNSSEEITEAILADFFQKEMDLKAPQSGETFEMLGGHVDTFFNELQSQSNISPTVANFAPKNEIQRKDFKTIIHYACMDTTNETEKQIKFEAQRKLLLIPVFLEVRDFYNSIRRKGIQPLDDLEATLQVPSAQLFGEKAKRTLFLNSKTYSVLIEPNQKQVGSLMRKVFDRDSFDFSNDGPFNDVFRESYIFDVDTRHSMNIERRASPCQMTNGNDVFILEYNAPLVVHEYITQLHTNAELRGQKIKIKQFKELPKEGESMKSSGNGGGGKIRVCKFYIEHTDEENEVRVQEMQMFLPKKLSNGEWVSGEEDYEYKKKDDKEYAMKRLFTHGTTYSLIELFFPYYIYGDRMKALFPPLKKK